MTRKILTYTGYILFGIITFVFFSYLNFPYHKIKDKLFAQIEKNSQFKVDVEAFQTTMLLGLKFEGIIIKEKNNLFPEINIPALSMDPSLLSLITFKPKIQFNAELPQGSLTGFFQHKGNTYQKVNLELNHLDLKKQFQEYIATDISGILEGQVLLDGNLQRLQEMHGETNIQIKKFTLGKITVLGMHLPQLSFSEVTLKGNIKKELFTIEKFQAGNDKDDLKANLSGDIALHPQNLNLSRLNLKLTFKMSDIFKEEFKLFLPLLSGAVDPAGNYSLNITGTLAAPVALPAKS